jgi:hypothetical protein
MIFTIHKSEYFARTFLVFDDTDSAHSAYNCLDACFPYNQDTCQGDAWEFFIESYGNYENAIAFNNTSKRK